MTRSRVVHAMAERESEADFLSRWSRRKRLARRGVDPDRIPAGAASDPGEQAPASETRAIEAVTPPEELTDADMPPIESLDEDSDYSAFLSPKVSEGLRRAALRKLFGGAAFNVTDGLDDYDEDFRSFTTLMDVVTERADHREDSTAALEEPPDAPDTVAAPGEPEPGAPLPAGAAPDPVKEKPAGVASIGADPEDAQSQAPADDAT